MKKMNNSFLFLTASILLSTAAHATQAPPTQYDDVVENYLAPGKGSTVSALTNLSNNSRWYGTYRLKAGYLNYDSTNAGYLQLNGRLRGKTYFAEKTAIIGDFWLKGQENYVQNGRNNTNGFDDFDEKVSWEQFRFGISHDDLGALMYGKHTATWSLFTVDMGSQGLFDTQGDAGLKNAGKFLYKKQFPNNLFLSGSWDYDSHIYGIDVGYQTADIYSYKPNDYGLYVSMHNG
ncbi:MAG TPA: hypothetical protein VJY31_01720 [Buttiauxella sp.]|nr:hypothetical protein [Buttiauxella sp.]